MKHLVLIFKLRTICHVVFHCRNLDPRDEAREFEMKYLRKLELRCEAQLTKGRKSTNKMT